MKRLQKFIRRLEAIVESETVRPEESVAAAMKELVASDDWLPASMSQSHPVHYQQHLIYADPQDRFSIVSFVWGPGQKTPIHDHTVWGVIGVLRGAEFGQRFDLVTNGPPCLAGPEERLEAGSVDIVSATRGDVHVVRNALDDRVSISIHAYGGNIGRINRHVFDAATGQPKTFVSGYSNTLPVDSIFPTSTQH